MAVTVMGDQGGYDDNWYSDELERKTNDTKKNPNGDSSADMAGKIKVDSSGQSNALNSYRSVTYSFTLAGLKKNYLKNPKAYRDSELDLVILKSGGKADAIMRSDSVAVFNSVPDEITQKSRSEYAARDPRRIDLTDEQKSVPLRDYGGELLNGFNTESPGRFDMFIENVEIETLMSFTENGGATLPTQIKFDVIEPYSVNGFIEALHFAAIGAGYPSYLQASFVLKMEFWGYPDNDLAEFVDPEKIEKTERYFPIGLTNLEVDITEKGTRYKCSAVPFNERAFGEPNVVKKPIKMAGSTVKEILTDMIKNVNDQVSKSDKDGKEVSLGNKHNKYSIKFPSRDEKEGWKDTPENKIGESKLLEILKDNALYKMADPGTTEKATAYKKEGSTQPTAEKQAKEPEAIKYTPGKTVVQFAEGMNIHEAISAVIRDSEYVRNILKNVKNNIDEYGMIKYFMVRIEVTNLDEIDETSKKPFQNFTYVVAEYKLHYTRIPSYGQEQIDDKKLTKLCNREYNYIYTGKNVDILNFKLNFNTLYFEAVPDSFGNKDSPSSKTGAGPNDSVVTKQAAGTPIDTQKQQQVPTPPTKVETTPMQSTGGQAGQPLADAYGTLAKKMHQAITNSQTSMIHGEMEILGDPYFIATGGTGNFNTTPDGRGNTKEGEVDHLQGEVLIRINFRNPVDIDPETGIMQFDPKLIPFSGVYQVLKAINTFKDGLFKQRLEIIRKPGQILDLNIQPSDPADAVITLPNNLNRVVPDTTRAFNPSQRLDSSTALEQLDRGLPSPGLPGQLSNFTAASGGLGGSVGALLMQNPGRVSKIGELLSGSSVIGQALPTDIASNIRLNSSGLSKINQTGLGSAALIAAATGVLSKTIPAKSAVGAVAATILGGSIATALSKANKGSGIGEGATLKLDKVTTDPTGLGIKFGTNIDPSKLASDTVDSVIGASKELGTAAVGIVNGMGASAGNLIKDIGSKISSFAASSADPKAIAVQVGLDPSKLSGLGKVFQSKSLDQINSFGANLPAGVNLNQAAAAGVVVDYLSPSKIKNLPPTTPYTTAPAPIVDNVYIKEVAAKGGATALANLYGVSSVKELSSNLIPTESLTAALKNIPTSQINPFSNIPGQFNSIDVNSLKDKLGTANSQISQLTGKLPVIDQSLIGSVTAKFGSSSLGNSPLDKLVNGKFNLG
jgi:hypothetical protein